MKIIEHNGRALKVMIAMWHETVGHCGGYFEEPVMDRKVFADFVAPGIERALNDLMKSEDPQETFKTREGETDCVIEVKSLNCSSCGTRIHSLSHECKCGHGNSESATVDIIMTYRQRINGNMASLMRFGSLKITREDGEYSCVVSLI